MGLAWGFESLVGWPQWLYRRIRHPVVWFGGLISVLDARLNQQAWPHKVRYLTGVITTLGAVASAVAISVGLTICFSETYFRSVLEVLIASSLIASRSLYAHIADVARPLKEGDIIHARIAVSMIVGRDPNRLDEHGIARASLESLAENASDGVIAPLFWGAIFGLPGLVGYKAINTLDSMIGHETNRYAAFGGFAARLDDIANLIPARVTGLLLCAVSLKRRSFYIMIRDARSHRSPNAGWPEAAMAGALGICLSGPRVYDNKISDEPWLNKEAQNPSTDHIYEGLVLYQRSMVLAALLLAIILVLGLTQ